MARTQSPDYDKRRAAIVAKAARLFATRGFLGASIADLAQACRTSKSLVYHYYPSKEDILYAVMSAHLDDLLRVADEAADAAGGDAEARLRALTRAFMACYVEAAHSQKVLLNELDNLPPDKRRDIVARQRRIIAVVEAILVRLRPELAARADLQRPVAMLYFGMINWAHTWFDPGGAVPPDAFADLAADFVLHGLAGAKL